MKVFIFYGSFDVEVTCQRYWAFWVNLVKFSIVFSEVMGLSLVLGPNIDNQFVIAYQEKCVQYGSRQSNGNCSQWRIGL